MKNIFLIPAIVILFVFPAFSKDVIHLRSGEKIKGFITDINDQCVTMIKSVKNKEKEFRFTPDQVALIEFDLSNVHIAKILKVNADYSVFDGIADAQIYHKRFGGNFALGFFFGVFGFVGVAVGKVKEPPAYIEDWTGKMRDGDYVVGYDKKAKGKNIGAAGVGWAAWVVLMIILL